MEDEDDGRAKYQVSAVRRNGFIDWSLFLLFQGRGEELDVDGRKFTFRTSRNLRRIPAIKAQRREEVVIGVRANHYRGHSFEGYLSQQDMDNHLYDVIHSEYYEKKDK